MSRDAAHLVFVYGTLRRGFANHARHLGGLAPLAAARTVQRFALHVDRSAIPYLVAAPALHRVVGELYAVDDARLARLDVLEGHPDWYERRQVAVELTDGPEAGTVRHAWAYLCARPAGPLVDTGDYAEALRTRRGR